MNVKKMMMACFASGSLFCLVAIIFAPKYWWFGFVAGLAGGYLGYEFREFLRAVPVAFRYSFKFLKESVGELFDCFVSESVYKIRQWFSESHPFYYSACIISSPLICFLFWVLLTLIKHEFLNKSFLFEFITSTFVLFLIFGWVCYAIIGFFVVPIFFLASLGCKFETNKELFGISLSVPKLLGLSLLGIVYCIWFFIWPLWKHLFLFICRFTKKLLSIIHCHERVFCALNGTVGGYIGYYLLAPTAETFLARIVVILFGGVLGAAFGLIAHKLLPKVISLITPTENVITP